MKWWTIYSNKEQHLLAAPVLDPLRPKFSLTALGWPLDWAQSPLGFIVGVLLFTNGSIPAWTLALLYLGGWGTFIFMGIFYLILYPTVMYWFMRGWFHFHGYKPIARVTFLSSWEGALGALDTHKYYAVLYALNIANNIINNPYDDRFIPLDNNYYNKLANVLSATFTR